ncbi:hypothetical protein [Lentzea sp. NBRC 102530]|uniref:DUF1501 domain-containing protein n=1 Tax=Lentzea sp. NBRC 102530 TaxID=3032201 RepID=UPI0024A2CE7C|nr:hypothetical protein [Lentzea sp. NBRC 102530]GLY47651.1 hypothetical protein Lesp01_13070 [Lentzea sp. NBRC 102530]
MDSLTRRRFLTLSGVTAAGALALGATRVNWEDLMKAAADDPLDASQGVLVVVTLYGGNNGLNTVVPAEDRAYQDARPDLAHEPGEVLGLGEGLGLNPGLKGLKGLWDEQGLAVVRGVGYPRPDHSHFRSMAIWQTASPRTSVPSGWLGRWLDETAGGDPLRALSVEPLLPPMLAGERTAAASFPLNGLKLPQGPLGEAFTALGQPFGGEDPGRRGSHGPSPTCAAPPPPSPARPTAASCPTTTRTSNATRVPRRAAAVRWAPSSTWWRA